MSKRSKQTTRKLADVLEDPELAVFMCEWLKNGNNATKAYKSLHPTVAYESAMVLGSRQLRKVKIADLLAIYEIDLTTYMQQMKAGLQAVAYRGEKQVPDHKARRAYHEALGKLIGIEGKESSVNIQNNQFNVDTLSEAIAKARKDRGLPL